MYDSNLSKYWPMELCSYLCRAMLTMLVLEQSFNYKCKACWVCHVLGIVCFYRIYKLYLLGIKSSFIYPPPLSKITMFDFLISLHIP